MHLPQMRQWCLGLNRLLPKAALQIEQLGLFSSQADFGRATGGAGTRECMLSTSTGNDPMPTSLHSINADAAVETGVWASQAVETNENRVGLDGLTGKDPTPMLAMSERFLTGKDPTPTVLYCFESTPFVGNEPQAADCRPGKQSLYSASFVGNDPIKYEFVPTGSIMSFVS